MIPPFAPRPWADGAYSARRHGATIIDCDSEPVQTPGCIQAHGCLLVLRPADLTVLQASENSAAFLGRKPDALLNRPVSDVFGLQDEARLRKFLQAEPVERNPLYAFTLPARGAVQHPLDVTVHTSDGAAILEFEVAGPSLERSEPNYYALVKKSINGLQAAGSLPEFCHLAAAEIRALTGLDRVMVYRFHADGHGEVFAEARREDLAPWLGLHYPAEDIPKPAREIFRKIRIRPVPDVAGPLIELVPLANPDTGKPLDMTHCALRGASIMYTEYLQNMGVGAALTLSILCDGELWGLIACHHCKPTHFPYRVRAAAEFFAQVVSLQLRTAEEREQLEYRLKLEAVHEQLLAQASQEGGLAPLCDGSPSLLDGIDAGGAALYHRDRWWRVGQTPSDSQLEGLAAWLRARPELDSDTRPAFATDSLARDYPQAVAFAGPASGVLAVPFSRRGRDILLWFRPETPHSVTWAGNPHDQPTVMGPHGPRPVPRKSFERFVESVRQRAPPWKAVEIEAALRLRIPIVELAYARGETERKQAEDALTEHAHRLTLTMEAAATGMWDWDLSSDAVRWSARCYAIHGLREDEFDGTAAGFVRRVHPQDRERVWKAVRRAIDRRETYECSFRILRPDGEERWVENRGRALYDSAERPLHMIGTLVDVTDRNKADLERVHATALLNALSENTSDLIFTKDVEGRITYANPATIRSIGKPVDQVIGWTERDWCDDAAQAAAIASNDRNVMASGMTATVEETFKSAAGVRVFLSVKSPLRDATGKVVGLCGIARDITERRRQEEQLRDADQRKDEFIATLGHELRNPLASIHLGVEVLNQHPLAAGADARQVLDILERQIALMSRLIDDLLDASRATVGKLRLQTQSVLLDQVLAQGIELARPLIRKNGQALELSLPVPKVRLVADPSRLAQVFSNLLNNASKYGKRGGRIALRIEPEAGAVRVQVADDGVGIPAEHLSRIFDMFSQVDATLNRSQGGLGIGLSLARGLVEMHGGSIEAESDGPGRGSRFTVSLPCLAEADDARHPVVMALTAERLADASNAAGGKAL